MITFERKFIEMKLNKLQIMLAGLTILVASLAACKKDAGQGGTSTIKGKVLVYKYDNAFLAVEDTFPMVDNDVYIIYGSDHNTYDDNYKASFDGSYEFKFLQKGKYKLFAYSTDSTGAASGTIDLSRPKIPVFINVEITKNGSTVIGPDIIIIKNK